MLWERVPKYPVTRHRASSGDTSDRGRRRQTMGAKAIRVALSGIADDLEVGEAVARLAPLHPKNSNFPG
jgi:hypothetical protein